LHQIFSILLVVADIWLLRAVSNTVNERTLKMIVAIVQWAGLAIRVIPSLS
jgi:hypothetical protein